MRRSARSSPRQLGPEGGADGLRQHHVGANDANNRQQRSMASNRLQGLNLALSNISRRPGLKDMKPAIDASGAHARLPTVASDRKGTRAADTVRMDAMQQQITALQNRYISLA